jgi:hypothetical protein
LAVILAEKRVRQDRWDSGEVAEKEGWSFRVPQTRPLGRARGEWLGLEKPRPQGDCTSSVGVLRSLSLVMVNAISIAMVLGVAQATCTLGSPQQVPRGRRHIGGNGVLRSRGRYHEGRSEPMSLPPVASAKCSKPSQPKVVTCRYVAVAMRRGWERLGCRWKWRPIHPPL